MSIPRYIDSDNCETTPGKPGFLVETTKEGVSHWFLRDRPAKTNRTYKPQLNGWCGEDNNKSTYARGLARVVVHLPNARARIERIPDSESANVLEELGYPELIE
jgi:hypothetical protein